MVSEISTLGSCSSRNIFNSQINKNYKQYFHINASLEAVSLISLMSKPIKFDENLLNSDNDYDNYCVRHDLTKNYLNFLKTSKIDYLIIDTYFDIKNGVIDLKDTYITNSNRLPNTRLYDQYKDYDIIHAGINFNKLFKLWKIACDDFFKFLNENNPDIKVILNCSRNITKYIDKNNNIRKIDSVKKMLKQNRLRNILDTYLLTNHDVDILEFNDETIGFENHLFGLHPSHYVEDYYIEKTNQLNEIIKRYDRFNYNDDINIKIRQLSRDKQILKMKLENQSYKLNQLKKKMEK